MGKTGPDGKTRKKKKRGFRGEIRNGEDCKSGGRRERTESKNR